MKVTVDRELLEQAIDVLTKSVLFCNHMGVGDWQPTAMACHSGIAALRAILAEPAVEPVVCTNKQVMEVRNSIGLMKNEDERNNYGNHATAIKVLEAFLASPPPPAEVPMLTEMELFECFSKATGATLPELATRRGQVIAIGLEVEKAYRRKAGL